MNETVLLEKRKNRCIASILSTKEREIDRHLPEAARVVLRKVILDEINDFYSIVLDVLDNNINEDFLLMLGQIHASVVKEE